MTPNVQGEASLPVEAGDRGGCRSGEPEGQTQEGKDVFIHRVAEILLQHTRVFSHCGVHFKYLTMLPANYLPHKAEKKKTSSCSGLRGGGGGINTKAQRTFRAILRTTL